MNVLRSIVRICLIVCLATACIRGARIRTGVNPKVDRTQTIEFKVPVPPGMMEDPQERTEYILSNYWQNYKPEIDSVSLEQAFSNWIALTSYVDRSLAVKSLVDGYDKAPERIGELAERYLYDPNSPYRDEDLYGALAAHIGTPEMLALAKLCALNAVGTKAADFVFEDARGRRHYLYDIKGNYILLFFSNPGCNACKEIIDQLVGTEFINDAMESGYLAVVNIYIDEDLDAWREYLPNYPKFWHTGFDPLFILRNDSIYHIRAIPSVYVLSSDKTVLLKDAPTERMLEYLESVLP